MFKVFALSGEHTDIAREEVLALAGKKKHEVIGSLLITEADFDFSRLAYTKAVYDLLFTCDKSMLKNKMESYPWQDVFRKDFCVRVSGEGFEERELAGFVWRKLKKPKVNLTNPKTGIHVFVEGEIAVVCLLIQEIRHNFTGHKTKYSLHQSSIHPRLARAMVNLTGIKKGTLFDPFCGAGSILIEAGLMGFRVEGYDLSKWMVYKSEKNMKAFRIKGFRIREMDSTKITKRMPYVATDLPYGRSTVISKGLYGKFIPKLKRSRCAVVGFPDYADYRKIIKNAGLKIKREFTYYLNKSISRKIVVISP